VALCLLHSVHVHGSHRGSQDRGSNRRGSDRHTQRYVDTAASDLEKRMRQVRGELNKVTGIEQPGHNQRLVSSARPRRNASRRKASRRRTTCSTQRPTVFLPGPISDKWKCDFPGCEELFDAPDTKYPDGAYYEIRIVSKERNKRQGLVLRPGRNFFILCADESMRGEVTQPYRNKKRKLRKLDLKVGDKVTHVKIEGDSVKFSIISRCQDEDLRIRKESIIHAISKSEWEKHFVLLTTCRDLQRRALDGFLYQEKKKRDAGQEILFKKVVGNGRNGVQPRHQPTAKSLQKFEKTEKWS